MKNHWIILWVLLVAAKLVSGQGMISGQVLDATTGKPLAGCDIFLDYNGQAIKTGDGGEFTISKLNEGQHELIFFYESYASESQTVSLKGDEKIFLKILLNSLSINLNTIEYSAAVDDFYSQHNLRNVEGVAIYAAKKNEVIEIKNLVANVATNNARQIYKGIAGLNIWENDGSGLQLNIGARGLDPNRTSNFNTRQNGYDISADALGYPESYYTPPVQALKRIEIVRGAASLQYGPQFGGLLNFIFKNGAEKPFELTTENTIGSFGLLSSFNSIGGQKNGWNYFAFYQRKQGDGWRANSEFHQNTAFVNLTRQCSEKIKISVEFTHMDYLAQQSGGLMDFEFEQDARQSKRERNWFKVNWNLAAFSLDYLISDQTRINSRSFYLDARRQALGELGPINRPDPLRERDLIRGDYRNFGNETRLIHRYELGRQLATFLVGSRYYEGYTQNRQGDANDGRGADFHFLNPQDLERSSYEFPSRNISLFAENLFNVSNRLTLTPGARFEYIRTASDGYFKERVYSGGQVIFEQKFEDVKENIRSFVLLGLGAGYKPTASIELYANISQNFRSINFSDLAVSNPNLIVDSDLQDERGHNADIGIRGASENDAIRFDATAFYLNYKNRIGVTEIIVEDPVVVERAVSYRTNIGDARILGLEVYAETDVFKLLNIENRTVTLNTFLNASYLSGKYTSGPSAVSGNKVELIPPYNIKTGLNIRWKKLRAAYQFSQTGSQYSDATNAEFVVDATRGKIPSYQVQDLSVSFTLRKFQLQAGINNLTDARYFTRRATAYPGPGIIPADGRSFYLTVGYKL